MESRKTWVVDEARSLSDLEIRLNHLAGQGLKVARVLLVDGASAETGCVIIACLRLWSWQAWGLVVLVAFAFTAVALIGGRLPAWCVALVPFVIVGVGYLFSLLSD